MESTRDDSKAVHDKNKIFVGGLSQDTDTDSLRCYFERWGDIVDAVVMYDNNTRRSRGFGFVTFLDADSVNTIIEKGPHVIDRKEVECKKACPRDSTNRPGGGGAGVHPTTRTDKIFVGGLPDLTTEEFRQYFEGFGRVVDAVLMFDRNSNRPRGFGFVTFDNPDMVEKVIGLYREHYLKGKWVEVKRAQPKEMNTGRGGGYDRGGVPRDYAVGPLGYGLGDGGAGSYGHGPDPMYQQQPMQGAYSQHLSGRMGYGQPQVPGGGPPGVHGHGGAAYDTSGGYGGYPTPNRVPQGPPSQHAYASGGYGVSGYGGQAQGVSDSLHFSPPNTQPLSQQVGQSYHHPAMYSGGQPQFQQHGSQPHMTGANGPHGGMNGGMGGYGSTAQPQHPLTMAPQGGMMAPRQQTGYSPPHSREASGMGGQGVGQLSHDAASGYNMLLGAAAYGSSQGGGYGGMSPVGGHLDGLPQQAHGTHQQPGMGLALSNSGGGLGAGQPMGAVQNQYTYGLQDQSAGQGGMR